MDSGRCRVAQSRALSLINASLPYLPDVIFQLKSLESLTVTGSDITSITGMGSLVRLKSLILHSNSIDWLPDDFYKLTELEELDLHNNRVSHRGIHPNYLQCTIFDQ
ncbi:hypothetical protein BSLG_005945 [Batrachochytrium salamandrivorans]|nr:hypothetical protein BSLG_005945 [Batrachochytrium salamandrivorans]